MVHLDFFHTVLLFMLRALFFFCFVFLVYELIIRILFTTIHYLTCDPRNVTNIKQPELRL